MEWVDVVGGVVVALIAAFGGWAAQRASSRASNANTAISGRLDAERGAYERARIFDTETIRRQDVEIARLNKENQDLKVRIGILEKRLKHLEDHISPEVERLLNDWVHRADDQEPPDL
jgi:predicted nuclease with TOPRIM domain